MLNKSRLRYFPTLRRLLTRLQYEFISMLIPAWDVLFMNFGYEANPEGSEPISLDPQDEIHRYPLQLYHHLARFIDWADAEVLEVSSGRGGGASFLMRHFKPRSYLGVDFSTRAITFCRTYYDIPGLTFEHGNAEALRFPEASFDVVVNVEASLYYPEVEQFFRHVKRILKPGGHFLYTDLRFEEDVPGWIEQIEALGMKMVDKQNITDNILKALELDRDRRIHLVRTYAPPFLRKKFYFFIGLVADSPKATPRLPNRQYWCFILQKA